MFSAFIFFNILMHSSVLAAPVPPVCETLNGYEYCEIQIEGYPEKIAVISPKGGVSSVRFYFQGYILDPKSRYDRSLKSLVTTLQLYPLTQNERLIIPRSIGKCDTYKSSIPELNKFIELLKDWVPDQASLSVDGHSGAGSVISQWLSNEEIPRLKSVRIFDGIYSDTTVSNLTYWKELNPKAWLGVAFVKGWGSDVYSRRLGLKLKGKSEINFLTFVPEKNSKESPHYSIVRNVWLIL